MYLQKMRFGQRVRYDTDCAPETLEVLVPSFVLQPLVENSIKHGLSKDSKGGRIFIRTWMHNGRLWISVADTGVGMEEDRLKQIRAALNDGTENEIGIGVGNIYRRVRECTKTGKCIFTATKGAEQLYSWPLHQRISRVLESGSAGHEVIRYQGDFERFIEMYSRKGKCMKDSGRI